MANQTPVLLEERHGDTLLLTMNRPDRHNALNRALHEAISDALSAAEAAGVKVIVLTGAGTKAFCAGADMLEASGMERPADTARPRGAVDVSAASQVASTPLPVIAAINGYCYGGGARLAIACDIRLASRNATFRIPGAEYGLVVAAATLPRLVGAAKAKEWIFTARPFDAAEAREHGLVSSLHEQDALLAAALEMAATIAAHSTDAVREAKRVIDAATLSEAAMTMEDAANRRLRGSPDQAQRFRDATRRVTGR